VIRPRFFCRPSTGRSDVPGTPGLFGGSGQEGRRGAVTVEYALGMLIAAAILIGVEEEIFRPMAKDILENFMEFIVKPDP
jgi:hypothetical protein